MCKKMWAGRRRKILQGEDLGHLCRKGMQLLVTGRSPQSVDYKLLSLSPLFFLQSFIYF
jgi:hypothetical protein